jgi:hypothetical protein
MEKDDPNLTFGDSAEAGLSTAELATNATTWRHIWFLQRFVIHSADKFLALSFDTKNEPTCAHNNMVSLLHATSLCHNSDDRALAYQKLVSQNRDPMIHQIVANTMSWLDEYHPQGHATPAIVAEFHLRCVTHDQTKLVAPEVACFTSCMERLSYVEFGTPAYQRALGDLRPALDNHYYHNRHHPEHFEKGTAGMTLIDLIEMYCDWLASSLRTKGGDIHRSFEYTKKRFKLSEDLIDLMRNTHDLYFTEEYRRDLSELQSQRKAVTTGIVAPYL